MHTGLLCVLKINGIEYESSIDLLIDEARAQCSFDKDPTFFKNQATISLRDYNIQDITVVTESNTVPVIFIPGLTIYHKSETAPIYYFHQNFASEIALHLSNDSKFMEQLYCDFRSEKN